MAPVLRTSRQHLLPKRDQFPLLLPSLMVASALLLNKHLSLFCERKKQSALTKHVFLY